MESRIGGGSFGSTWNAVGDDGRIAAIKLLSAAPGEEVRALARVCHPAVVQLLDAGVRPVPWVAMELAQGQPLQDHLADGAFSEAQSADAGAILFDALAAVHGAGVTHGDIKPANLLMEPGPPIRLQIVDFGMAGTTRGGTPAYAAPEVIRGGPATAAADVYAAGMVVWEMLHGALPGASLDVGLAIARRCMAPPEATVGPVWLRDLLRSVLATTASVRPTAPEVADVFAAHGHVVPDPGVGLLKRRAQAAHVPRGAVDTALDQWLLSGGRVAAVGPARSGRTHFVDRAAVELRALGRNFVRLQAGGLPWSGVIEAFRARDTPLEIPDGPDLITRVDRVVARLIEEHPDGITLLVDDLDNLDAPSAGVLAGLLVVPRNRLCASAGSTPPSVVDTVVLGPMDTAELATLATVILGDCPEVQALVAELEAYSSGIPGLAVDYIVAAAMAGALTRRKGAWRWDPTRQSEVDAHLQVVTRAPPAVSPHADELLGLLAVHGDSVPLSALPEFSGRAARDVARALHELAATGLVRVDGTAVTIRDRATAGQQQARIDRAAVHQKLLAWRKSQQPRPVLALARHALGAGDAETAAEVGEAAVLACLREDPVLAAQLADGLMALAPSPPLALARIRAFAVGGRAAEARRFAEELFDGRPLGAADVAPLVALAGIWMNHDASPAAALQCLSRAEAALGGAPVPDALRLVEAHARFGAGEFTRSEALARILASAPAPAPGPAVGDWLRARYIWAQSLHRTGDLPAAIQALESVPRDLGAGSPERAAMMAAIGRLYWFAGRFKEADVALEQAASAEVGLPLVDRARLTNNVGAVRYSAGDRTGALRAWETALVMFERLEARLEVARAQVNLCLAYRDSGRWERGRQAGAAAASLARELGAADLQCIASENLGQLALAQGDLDEADRRFSHAAGIAKKHGLVREAVDVEIGRAEVSVMRRDPGALDLATGVEATATAQSMVVQAGLAAAMVAVELARAGRSVNEVDAAISRATGPLKEAGAEAELAFARLWTSEALLASGRPAEASEEAARVRIYARESQNVALTARSNELSQRVNAHTAAPKPDERLDRLIELAVDIGSEREMSTMLERIAQSSLDLIDGDRAFVLLGSPVTIHASAHRSGGDNRISMSVVEQAIRTKAEIIAVDVTERGNLRDRESIANLDLRSVLCVPMVHRGTAIGAIYVDSHTANRQKLWETAQLMRALAALGAMAILKMRDLEESVHQARRTVQVEERKRSDHELSELAAELYLKNAELERLNRRLQHSVTTDPLTGIGNRRHMMDTIRALHAAAQDGGPAYSVLFIDIDNFKSFNDRHGHPVGDRALVAIAQVLRDALRSCDAVFRYGGEELVVTTPLTDRTTLGTLAERLRLAAKAVPIDVGSGSLEHVTISVGCAVFDATRSPQWEDVLAHADAALYRAKRAGRDRSELWEPELQAEGQAN